MARAPAPAFLALEGDAAASSLDARVWRTASGSPWLSLREVLSHVPPGGAWPAEDPLARVTVPRDLRQPEPGAGPAWLLPSRLSPAEKRVLDLLSDWPWIAPAHLGGLLGVSAGRVSQLTGALEDAGLAARVSGRLAAGDRGLALLARRPTALAPPSPR